MGLMSPFFLWFYLSSAFAQGPKQHGTTGLRLDAVDISQGYRGEFTFFGTFLNSKYKPITITEVSSWGVTFDGEQPDGELKITLLEGSPHSLSLAIVFATYQATEPAVFSSGRKGVNALLNRLRPSDRSAVVIYGATVEASGNLSPAHNEAISWLSEKKLEGVSVQLFESIDKGLNLFPTGFDTIGPNRAILVVSDGYDETMENPTAAKDRLQSIQREAKRRNVRINVVGNATEGEQQLEKLRKLAGVTGGTYRMASNSSKINIFISHLSEELLKQHVISFQTTDFEENKDTAFKIKVEQGGQDYNSNAIIRLAPERESHLLLWLGLGLGGLLLLLLLFFLLRFILRRMGSKQAEELVPVGPESSLCGGCGNMIPLDWKVCRYCEALPHLGKLIVSSSGALNGHTFFIRESLTNIGSAEGNTIVIPDGSVSKHHAGIKVRENRFELADFGSTNGVLVNDQRINKQFLKDGDRVSVGAVQMEFKLKR